MIRFNRRFIYSSSMLLIILLTGCADSSKTMVISPQLNPIKTNNFTGKVVQLDVTDLRNSIHIITVFKEDQAAQLISSSSNIEQVVLSSLKESLKSSGLTLDAKGQTKVTFIINTAQIRVQQSMLNYQAKSKITLTAKIQSSEKTLTKTYNSTTNSEGALSADIAVLERDFNQQLSAVLLQIIDDKEIHQFIE